MGTSNENYDEVMKTDFTKVGALKYLWDRQPEKYVG